MNQEYTTNPSGLKYLGLQTGSGDTARAGHRVSVHYTGWLAGGQKFDSSRDRREPFEFRLGVGRVIPPNAELTFEVLGVR